VSIIQSAEPDILVDHLGSHDEMEHESAGCCTSDAQIHGNWTLSPGRDISNEFNDVRINIRPEWRIHHSGTVRRLAFAILVGKLQLNSYTTTAAGCSAIEMDFQLIILSQVAG